MNNPLGPTILALLEANSRQAKLLMAIREVLADTTCTCSTGYSEAMKEVVECSHCLIRELFDLHEIEYGDKEEVFERNRQRVEGKGHE